MSNKKKKKYLKLRQNFFQLYLTSYQSEFVRVEFIVKKRKKYLEPYTCIFLGKRIGRINLCIRSIDRYLNLSFFSKHSIVIVSIVMQHYGLTVNRSILNFSYNIDL